MPWSSRRLLVAVGLQILPPEEVWVSACDIYRSQTAFDAIYLQVFRLALQDRKDLLVHGMRLPRVMDLPTG